MKTLLLLSILLLTAQFTPAEENNERLAELDALWSIVSHTVRKGDFEGYKATCHKEGVLVAGTSGSSHPLSQALTRWKPGFADTKEGKIKASVQFRFSQRLNDETTAHETGMFLYATVNAEGETKNEYIHFEALLVKRNGWKVLMEYQKSKGTRDDWDKLKAK